MIKVLLCALLSSATATLAQKFESEFETKGLIKICVYPTVWTAFRGNLSLIMYYERELRNRTSYNIVLDYSNFPFKHFNAGQGAYTNTNFYFRPQIRRYFGQKIYRGFYLGLFPLYNYRKSSFEQKQANYFGAGLLSGYQFFIKKRYPIEINIWLAHQYGKYNKIDVITGTQMAGRESFGQLGIELNLQWPIIRKRKE